MSQNVTPGEGTDEASAADFLFCLRESDDVACSSGKSLVWAVRTWWMSGLASAILMTGVHY